MKIQNITDEQRKTISSYNSKWLQSKLKFDIFDDIKACEIIQEIYNYNKIKPPKIIVSDDPYQCFKIILSFSNQQLGDGIASLIENQVLVSLKKEIKNQIHEVLWRFLWFRLHGKLEKDLVDNIEDILWEFLENKQNVDMGEKENEYLNSLLWIEHKLNPQTKYEPELEFIYNCVSLNVWASYGSYFDFCISGLNCTHSKEKWYFFKMLTKHLGWIFPYENICIISAPPCFIYTDNQQLLHAENTPAIKFLDNYIAIRNDL